MKISAIEKCENYWYCPGHISLSENIDVAARAFHITFLDLTRENIGVEGGSDTEGSGGVGRGEGKGTRGCRRLWYILVIFFDHRVLRRFIRETGAEASGHLIASYYFLSYPTIPLQTSELDLISDITSQQSVRENFLKNVKSRYSDILCFAVWYERVGVFWKFSVKKNIETTIRCFVIVFLRTIVQSQFCQFVWKRKRDL